jgi:hypothetical protein
MAIVTPVNSGSSGFTNPMTTEGDIIIENATPAPARLALGAAGTVLGQASSLPAWVYPPGFEINYTQITSSASITDTSEATATALISPGAITFDGGIVLVEFFTVLLACPTAAATNTSTVTLFEGSTQITRLATAKGIVTGAVNTPTVLAHYRFTPSSGSHTYKVCGFATSTTGTPAITAGAGGTGANPPAYVRFTKV